MWESTPCNVPFTLTASGPITVSANGQVIENMFITAENANGVTVNGFSNVTICNCLIKHRGAAISGIYAASASNLTICNNNIINTGSPVAGFNSDEDQYNIFLDTGCSSVTVTSNRVENGSSGIFSHACSSVNINGLEGHNMRGGPGVTSDRGQLVQFGSCTGTCILTNFSVKNELNVAWTEDCVNVHNTPNAQISFGLIDGNNSPSGWGILCEGGSNNCVVHDCDAINWSNGAFASAGTSGTSFTNCRARDSYSPCSQNRGVPSSNSLCFGAFSLSSGIIFSQCIWFNLVNSSNILFNSADCAQTDITGPTSFTPRAYYVANVPVG